jgi:hypothetical protein
VLRFPALATEERLRARLAAGRSNARLWEKEREQERDNVGRAIRAVLTIGKYETAMNPSRVRSLIEGKSSEFLLQALPFRGLFGLAKLTGEFEKLLRPLGFSDACSTSRESLSHCSAAP